PSLKGISPPLVAVTPGIRTHGDVTNDQKRVASPVEALELGADYLVIGRSITGHDNPEIAAARIATAIETYRRGSLEAELGK
ncbi:MAG: orotidine 5'-phosphate decarboxylase / HUMPS family protein, partial [Actinomycetota bacterium]|nr:orotidine 5'-phosphate decarboxylase / HUMPS family protein [Actinomycetota bacterium]